MGLFKELALLPIAPVRGTVWLAEQLAEEADRQVYDEDAIKRELVQLEIDHQDGAVNEAEREIVERDLLERLAVARQRRAAGEPDLAEESLQWYGEYEPVQGGEDG